MIKYETILLILCMVYALHKPYSSRQVVQKEKKKEQNKAIPLTSKAKSPHTMSPNYPRGQRSHGEIINRNAKGMGNRKTDFEKKNIVLYR